MTFFKQRKLCEICGSTDAAILLSKEFLHSSIFNFIESYYAHRVPKKYFDGQNYEIFKCNNCGFIWQSNVLNENLMELLYSEWISTEESLNKKRYADIDLYSKYARDMQTIEQLLNKKPFETKILDFGMGWGYWCLMAKAFGYDVSGYDISPERIKYAKNNGIRVIGYEEILKGENFDFINAEQVFEHITNPLVILKNLTRCLKKSGIIHISVPNGKCLEKELINPEWIASKNAVHPLEHINYFTNKTLVDMGNLAGLEAIKSLDRYNHNFYNKSKITFKSILSKILHSASKNSSTKVYFRKIV